MFQFIILIATATSALAGYAGSATDGNKVGDGSYGYGYSGSFAGPGGVGGGQLSGGYPDPNFNFQQFLNSYFESLRKYHQQFAANPISYSHTSKNLDSTAKASSSLIFPSLQQANQNAAAGYGFPGGFPAFAGFGAPGQYGGGFAGGAGGAPGSLDNRGGFGVPYGSEGAVASAAIGPQGVHQAAAVYPENPNNPNINTRFGAPPQGGGDNGGFYGVSTSSFSGSSNIDGKPSSFHQASTTVNDNGNVTTYTVRKP